MKAITICFLIALSITVIFASIHSNLSAKVINITVSDTGSGLCYRRYKKEDRTWSEWEKVPEEEEYQDCGGNNFKLEKKYKQKN